MLQSITRKSDRYGKDLWSYRISGNMLELSVQPKYLQNQDLYRDAVICAGKLLQAMDCHAAQNSRRILIQSFPNLEEPQLVAIVRMVKPDDGLMPGELYHTASAIDTESPVIFLKSIASQQGLFFIPVNPQAMKTPEAAEILSSLSVEPDGAYGDTPLLYCLCSTTDNPFIWLKTGYWEERGLQIISDNPSLKMPVIHERIPGDVRSRLSFMFENCSYAQALILV